MEEELEIKNKKKEGEKTGTGTERGTINGIIGVDKMIEEEKPGIGESEILHRLSATREADKALNSMVDRINDGFKGGRVNRTQALSWLLIKQSENLSESAIQEIRTKFFDEVSMLEAILRQAKSTGKIPQELRGVLQKHIGMDEPLKRKSKKTD